MSEQPNVEYGDSSVALANEILRSIVGSGVHGIAIEGTDDRDDMGVYVEPPEVSSTWSRPTAGVTAVTT